MRRVSILMLLGCVACAKGRSKAASGDAPPAATATPTQTETATTTEPGDIPQVCGTFAQPAPQSPPPTKLPLPTVCQGVDLLTLAGEDTYAPGRGASADAKSFVFAPCMLPLPPLKHATLTPTVDGDLADWGTSGIVAIDHAGDGLNGEAARDLRALRFAEDDTSFYVGIELAADWAAATNPGGTLVVVFYKLTEDDAQLPPTRYRDFAMGDSWFLEDYAMYGGQPAVTVPAGKGAKALKGRTFEVKLDKAAYFADLGPRFAVGAFLVDLRDGWRREDGLGTYVAGYEHDYACPVNMPDGSFKLFNFARNASVAPETAEVMYRQMIAAAPETEHVIGATYAFAASVSMTILEKMLSDGANLGLGGIYVEPRWASEPPAVSFGLMAHEYAHSYNGTDYYLTSKWLLEGHSEWARLGAIRSYFGDGPWAEHVTERKTIVHDTEAALGSAPLITEPWVDPADHAFYSYSKAWTLFDRLGAHLDAAALAAALDYRPAKRLGGYTDAEARARLEAALQAKGVTGVSWTGWLDAGAYGGAFATPE